MKDCSVFWSGGRVTGTIGDGTVDVPNTSWTNTIGDPELIAVWTDPDFDPKLRAFYYARAIEIPTPRWTAYDAKAFGLTLLPEVPMVTQERAYTSPIWYTPAGGSKMVTVKRERRWLQILFCSIGLAALAAMPRVAHGQEGAAQPGTGWTFIATPYVWFAGLEGDLGAISALPPVEVDASFSDIIENTDIAMMLAAEARRDRWGLLLDIVYLSLSADADTPGPLFGSAEVESKTLFTTLAAAYRVVEHGPLSLDGTAGARLWSVDNELDLSAGLLPARTAGDDEFWADPVIGLRAHVDLGRGFFLASFADIGGFGVGSDLTWQIGSTVGYQIKDWLWVRAGYRHLKADYEDDGFVFDVDMSGPILGVGLRF